MKHDPRTDPDVPAGMSIELLKDLHLLTRDGALNADARRKLKQIRHLVNLLKPALDDSLARAKTPLEPLVVDCGAGKSYLGALLYELVLGPAGRGMLVAIEARPELSEQAATRAARFGQERFRVATGHIAAASLAGRPNVVTALHGCSIMRRCRSSSSATNGRRPIRGGSPSTITRAGCASTAGTSEISYSARTAIANTNGPWTSRRAICRRSSRRSAAPTARTSSR